MLPYVSLCILLQSMASLCAVLLPLVQSMAKSQWLLYMQFFYLWATLSDQYNSASKFQIRCAVLYSASFLSSSKFKSTNLISKSTSKLNQFGLQVQSQLGFQIAVLYSATFLNSIRPSSAISTRPPNVYFFSTLFQNWRIIPQWNFSHKSSQPSKSALATAELSDRGISP